MRALALIAAALGCAEYPTHRDVPDAPALACTPNLDGRIEAAELRAAVGVAATYRVAADRAVDLRGQAGVFDFGGAVDDPKSTYAAAPLGPQWYAARFPAGAFVLSAGGVDSVYSQDDDALRLHGLASTDPAPPEGATLLVYATPVPVLRFPLVDGAAWSATGRVDGGTLRGLPYAGEDRYAVRVDGGGQVFLPELVFAQAHRVRTLVTVTPDLGAPSTRRQVSFLFECVGEVVRATSRPDEPIEDFTTAAELRRLAYEEP